MSISGFIEWLPEIKAVENHWINSISDIYSRNGFLPIETASVELLKDLETKGEIDKEIYVIDKINSGSKVTMALHYDLTVPTARYISENYSSLPFPFKRQQIQKVWRGERPQFGRYREFYQADIDIIDNGKLSLFYDAEVLVLGVQAMNSMGIKDYKIGISNRRIYESYLLDIGITDVVPVLRVIDKLDKIGEEKVHSTLVNEFGISSSHAEQCLLLSRMSFSLDIFSVHQVNQALEVKSVRLKEAIDELMVVVSYIKSLASESVLSRIEVDFSFVRGFDYYTGTIFEGKFKCDNKYGSICSGGRYDDLTKGFSNRKLPGVGFSIGITRILAYLHKMHPDSLDQIVPIVKMACFIIQDSHDNKGLFDLGKLLVKNELVIKIIHAKNLKIGLGKADKLGATTAFFMMDNEVVLKYLNDGSQRIISGLQPTEVLNLLTLHKLDNLK